MEPKWLSAALLVVTYVSQCVDSQPGMRMRSGTLYTASDPVNQLNRDDFSQKVFGKPYVWVIEFYASWCGHCQHFSPTWKSLGGDINDWQQVARIGAVACSLAPNAELCRTYGINRYPTIKLFSPNSGADDEIPILEEEKGRDVTSMRRAIIDFIAGIQQKPNSWPSLEAIESLQETWIARSSVTRRVFVVVESNNDAYLGKEVILDMSRFSPALIVRRMPATYAAEYGVISVPALYALDENNRMQEIPRMNDRKSIVSYLKGILGDIATTSSPATVTTTLRPTESITSEPDRVYMQDLESHLRYSLWNEVPSTPFFSSNRLQALKYHIRLLSKYHPGNSYIRKFLKKVDDWMMKEVHSNLTGELWVRKLDMLESSDAYIPKTLKWTGCRGSQPRYRGYPCSIWVTFHALTVNALNMNIESNSFNPLEVLLGLRSYVQYFFGCRGCARHFAGMAVNMESEVRNKGDGVIWLWRAHNRVNQRLHGDVTEDRAHIKIQFPAYQKCADCHVAPTETNQNVSNWRTGQVLRYLRRVYNKYNIVQDAVAYNWTSRVTSTTQTTTVTTVTTSSPRRHTCVPFISVWSACSRTCGVGTSTRTSNQNRLCLTRTEIRLCQLRPCSALQPQPLGPTSCRSTFTEPRETALVYGHCRSIRQYRWFYCGLCPGRTCTPRRARTVWMAFRCSNRRRRGYARVQWIDWCQCHT